MIHPSTQQARHSSRVYAAPYPYPASRHAAVGSQKMASHPGFGHHQAAAFYAQQQQAAAGTIGGGYPVVQQQQESTLPRLSFDRSTVHLPSYTAAPMQWANAPAATAQPFAVDSSPYSEAASDDFADAEGEYGYEEEESFEEGLVKDQYRGRGWDAGRTSSVSSLASASTNAGFEQQQRTHAYQAPVQQNGHLDRLFGGLQLPPIQQQQYYGQQQQQMLPPLQQAPPSPVAAPAAPATPTSALPLAPYLADAVWALLQQTPTVASVANDWSPSTPSELKYGSASFGNKKKSDGQVQINGQWDDDRWFSNDSYGYRTPPQFTIDDFALPAPVPSNAYRLSPVAPPTFARFINQTLAQTLLSPTAVFLGLWYIAHRMPVHEGGGEEGVMFRDELMRLGRKSVGGEEVARRVVTLGLAWANKWLDDNTFTNRSWSDVTHIPIDEINRLELSALATMSFDLTISDADWSAWLNRLYSSTSVSVVRSALVEMADALSLAETARLVEAQEVEIRLQEAKDEREMARRDEERRERLLEVQAWEFTNRQRLMAQQQAQQQAQYYPVSCARYSTGPSHNIHQHGPVPAACW